MAEIKWQRYCRLCANKKNQHQLVSLVDNGQEKFDVTHKIAALHIQFSTQDNLPQEICQNCLYRLEITFIFITACRKAQTKLIQLAHSGINLKDNIIVSCQDKKSNNVQSRESTHMSFKPTVKTKSRDIEQKTLPVVSNSIKEPIVKEHKSEDNISNGMKMKTEISKPCDIEVDVDLCGTESVHGKDEPLNACPEESKHSQESTPNDPAKPHHCSMCNKTFKTHSGYKFHAKTEHSVMSPHLCELCGKRFKHQTNLNAHRRTHLSEDLRKLVQCLVCDKKFINKFLLKEHLNGHYNLKPFFCSVCNKSFTSSHNLQRHSLIHDTATTYECAVCGKSLLRRRTLVLHLRRHGEALKYRCRICDTRFESRGQLRTHGVKVHTQDEMRERKREHDKNVVKCPSCPKLLSKTTLSAHVRSYHSGQSFPISCEICGKGLSGRASLAYHMKAIHSEQGGDWTCIYCGLKFMTRNLCSRHEYKHTGDAPFKCPQCDKRFRSVSTLHQHRLVHESPSPQHTCQVCGKQFKRKAALDVHWRIHSGNLPFSCPDCNKTFAQKNDMLKHHRARHSDTSRNISKTNAEVKENQEHNEQTIIEHGGNVKESPPITQVVLVQENMCAQTGLPIIGHYPVFPQDGGSQGTRLI
uniref:Zinc finger protein 808 n=1 Tax=Cacopsylla melanoneura TaxID=428564 RepID=A0A8D8RAX3_9HEMI